MADYNGIEENKTPFLDLDELERESYNPDKTQKYIFKLILKKCHDRIRKKNKENSNKFCYFDIPLIIPGYPSYKLDAVNHFIITQLSLNGLYAEQINPQRIYISWNPNDINKDLYYDRAEFAVQQNNIYKIKHSPLETDEIDRENDIDKRKPRIITEYPKLQTNNKFKNKRNFEKYDEVPVTLLQYDGLMDDMIPVNPKKVDDMYNNILPQKINKKPFYLNKQTTLC